jgi:hypothetical protein
MSGRRPRRQAPSQLFDAGPPKVSPDMLRGVYANSIRSIGTENEVVIDFSQIVPKDFDLDPETVIPRNVKLDHQVVARVIIPLAVFEAWIAPLIERNRTQAKVIADEGKDTDEQG